MAAGDVLLDANGNRLLDASGNVLLSTGVEACCVYLLYTCPEPGVASTKYVSAADAGPGDYVTDDGGTTIYHIPVGAVAVIRCPEMNVVEVTAATEEECEDGGGGEPIECGPCVLPEGVCGWKLELSGFTGDAATAGYNGTVGSAAFQFAPGSCVYANSLFAGGPPIEFVIECVDGFWYLTISDELSVDPSPSTGGTAVMGPNTVNYPPTGSIMITMVGGIADGQVITATITALLDGDPLCEE